MKGKKCSHIGIHLHLRMKYIFLCSYFKGIKQIFTCQNVFFSPRIKTFSISKTKFDIIIYDILILFKISTTFNTTAPLVDISTLTNHKKTRKSHNFDIYRKTLAGLSMKVIQKDCIALLCTEKNI